MKIKILMILAVISLSLFKTEAQQPQASTTGDLILENGVAAHQGLDEVYRRFSEGYRKLDAASVAGLYTETASYLAPGSEVQIGREGILKNFSGFFDSVKKQNGKIEISFRILQRAVDRNLAYDVGIYTLVSTNGKGESRRDSGKFVVVAKREKNDVWRFQVDGYSDLPKVSSSLQKQSSMNGAVSQTELQTIRRDLEGQYAKLAEAIKNKDFEAFQALRTTDFSTVALNAGPQTTEQMVARTKLLLSVIQPPIKAGFEILNLTSGNSETVVATVRQRFSRMQEIAGKIRSIETAVTQDETWVKTPEGWKLRFVENEKDLLRFIDGKRVEPGKPYDPNAPPYNPLPETSFNQKDLENLQEKGFVKGRLGERIDDLMNNFGKEGYSGAVLIAQNDEILLHKGYGWADRERKLANTPQTLYNVASVGKTFTAAAILKLEMQGKLSTSDAIGKYLGKFRAEKNGATIHHLLTHTAGLVVDGAPLSYESRKTFVQSVKETPIDSKPGEKYRYSNAGYVLLAAIVEEISGMPFEIYLQKNIFDPAGLNSTGYPWDVRFKNAPVAIGYKGDKLEELKPTEREQNVWGNRGPGNLITTVGDLYKWIQALRKNTILSEQAKKKMFTAYANGTEGYGWHVMKTARNITFVRRGGGRPDFESEVQWYIDENTVIIFTVNSDLNFRRRVAPAIEKLIWDKPSGE